MVIFSGFSSNGISYAKLSDNGLALVVFTGPELEHKPPSRLAEQGFYLSLKRLTPSYSTYLLSRRPDMSKGYSARDKSEGFAGLVESEIEHPVHIMGMSSGGSSAMYFAVDHADLMDRLVLAIGDCSVEEWAGKIMLPKCIGNI
jgi:hypothetical protein